MSGLSSSPRQQPHQPVSDARGSEADGIAMPAPRIAATRALAAALGRQAAQAIWNAARQDPVEPPSIPERANDE